MSNMSVSQFVSDTISKHLIFIASKTYCPYCVKAKNVFKDLGVQNAVHVLELDTIQQGNEIQNELSKRSGSRTVPSIWLKGKFVEGGSDGLMKMVRDGSLNAFLKENGLNV